MIMDQSTTLRVCFRDPIPDIMDAAHYLDAAISAYTVGHLNIAENLIRLADMPSIRKWTESIWGKDSPYVQYRPIPYLSLPKENREKLRMPTLAEKHKLHLRDGYHCRFCGIPVIRKEVRTRITKAFPDILLWGKQNIEQHAALQAMWAQYDHVLPHSKGGSNALDNIVVTCAPCNFGRMSYILEEVGLSDPRLREPISSKWDGLERILISDTPHNKTSSAPLA